MKMDFDEYARRWIRGRVREQTHARNSARVTGFRTAILEIISGKREHTCREERRRN